VFDLLTLEEFLKSKKLWYRFVSKPDTIHTSDASKLTGVNLNQLTKNLVGTTSEGKFVLLIVPGDRRVDLRKASHILGTRNVSLIPFREAESISGYPPGGTPSIGHKVPLSVVMDESLLKYETIFCGGGTRDKILELRTQDVISLNNATVGKLVE
jgi:Cys-tRNA(Pro)/Cys-tRNA(Cys) deacylase